MSSLPKLWQKFVLQYGWRADVRDLAAVVGVLAEDIHRLRSTGAMKKLSQKLHFGELFTTWHGREPRDDEWPGPYKLKVAYVWNAPEVALLASLVGRMSGAEISQVLTQRLRRLTGDSRAWRSPAAVQIRINRIGMQNSDVVDGITVADAGREIGSVLTVRHAIENRRLRAGRVGRLLVIPREAWAEWKATRIPVPKGFVVLSNLKQRLAIRSDKLSEFARAGLIPTAMLATARAGGGASSSRGVWCIDGKLAKRLVADRLAGRPMPWHGQANASNLRVSWKLFEKRRHPAQCPTCKRIWGSARPPVKFDDYALRYPPLAHGAKRHLTMPWSPGLTLEEVAVRTGRSVQHVRRAVANGRLEATRHGSRLYVTRTNATIWKAQHSGTGDTVKSWITLSAAAKQYLFSVRELRRLISEGTLRSRIGTLTQERGKVYVLRHQLAQLRASEGFSLEEAARRAGVTIKRFEQVLKGVHWRGTGGIPLITVQAVMKRLQSACGLTIEEAMQELGVTREWISERRLDGTIKVLRSPGDGRRLYISVPMLERLRAAIGAPIQRFLGPEWLLGSAASFEAGVARATLNRWAEAGDLEHQPSPQGMRYHQISLRARAREFWSTRTSERALRRLPAWLVPEAMRSRPSGRTPSRSRTGESARSGAP